MYNIVNQLQWIYNQINQIYPVIMDLYQEINKIIFKQRIENIYQKTTKSYSCHLINNMDYLNVRDGQKVIVDLLVINYKIDQ